jgi:hypothetical protein
MRKIRMIGTPNDYGLVEETDVNGTIRRVPIKRRLLADEEKIYGIQRLWTSTNSKFVLVKKSEYADTNNNNKVLADKLLLRSLPRQKSLDRDLHEGKSLLTKKTNFRFIFLIELHVDHQSKSRTLNGALVSYRTSLAPIPSTPKNRQQNKRSLKTMFLASKS